MLFRALAPVLIVINLACTIDASRECPSISTSQTFFDPGDVEIELVFLSGLCHKGAYSQLNALHAIGVLNIQVDGQVVLPQRHRIHHTQSLDLGRRDIRIEPKAQYAWVHRSGILEPSDSHSWVFAFAADAPGDYLIYTIPRSTALIEVQYCVRYSGQQQSETHVVRALTKGSAGSG